MTCHQLAEKENDYADAGRTDVLFSFSLYSVKM
jgi:hypothetical protein